MLDSVRRISMGGLCTYGYSLRAITREDEISGFSQ